MKNSGNIRGKASLPNIQELWNAGIDPKTGLPIKFIGSCGESLKPNIKKLLRIKDEQDAVNRFKWYNLPNGLTGEELERMIYYKGQLAFFYFKEVNKFYFMPYALSGTLDFYGRYNTIHPVAFVGGVDGEEVDNKMLEKEQSRQNSLLSEINLRCCYEIMPEDMNDEDRSSCCVLIHDYTKQLSQNIIPRVNLQEPLIDVMSDCIPFLKTAMIAGCGIRGIRVGSPDEEQEIKDGATRLYSGALKGEIWQALTGTLEFQELGEKGAQSKLEEYMMALQSLDNFRLSLYGLDNSGTFEKKSHMLGAEQEMNSSNNSLIMDDGLQIRKHFCDIVNSIWNLGINVEENTVGQEEMNVNIQQKSNNNSTTYNYSEGGGEE